MLQPGLLIIAGNHLGRTDDIPARSLEAARNADLVVFEEDRVARQILKAAGVHKNYMLLSEHRQAITLEDTEAFLKQGKTVLYMSDQGMPNVADPGRDLISIAKRTRARIQIIPGPSSVTAAVAACPFVQGPFYYRGFLSRDKNERRTDIEHLKKIKVPVILMDTPYRMVALLEDLAQHYDKKAQCMLALDISGPAENYLYGTAAEVLQQANGLADVGKLNFVLICDVV